MKKDLATAIGTAIVGVLIAYFVCNLIVPPIESVTYKTIDETVTIDLTEPSVEVFNYKALNPTVEVFVGSCEEYNENGECVEVRYNDTEDEEEVIIEEGPEFDTEVDQENQ